MPVLAPPPKSPSGNAAFTDGVSRFNPFDKGDFSAFSATEGFELFFLLSSRNQKANNQTDKIKGSKYYKEFGKIR